MHHGRSHGTPKQHPSARQPSRPSAIANPAGGATASSSRVRGTGCPSQRGPAATSSTTAVASPPPMRRPGVEATAWMPVSPSIPATARTSPPSPSPPPKPCPSPERRKWIRAPSTTAATVARQSVARLHAEGAEAVDGRTDPSARCAAALQRSAAALQPNACKWWPGSIDGQNRLEKSSPSERSTFTSTSTWTEMSAMSRFPNTLVATNIAPGRLAVAIPST